MCYGNRSNTLLSRYSGLTCKDYSFNVVPVCMVIEKSTHFYALKASALLKVYVSVYDGEEGCRMDHDFVSADEGVDLDAGFIWILI